MGNSTVVPIGMYIRRPLGRHQVCEVPFYLLLAGVCEEKQWTTKLCDFYDFCNYVPHWTAKLAIRLYISNILLLEVRERGLMTFVPFAMRARALFMISVA